MNEQASRRKAVKPSGRSSHTAAKVARGVLFAAREPLCARLIPAGVAESIEEFALAAGVLKPWMLKLFENEWYQRTMFGLMASLWPGEMMRLALRKRLIDDEVRDAIENGAIQLLIVGAGFDTLGLRIAKDFSHISVVEVDTPATATKRCNAIEKLTPNVTNHEIIPADMGSTPLPDVLGAATAWNRDARTVIVVEGVFMYLSGDQVRTFFAAIRESTGAGSRLVFSYLTADEEGRPSMGRWSGLSRISLKLIGEPLKWCLREGELQSFVDGAGYRLLGPPERYDLRERYLVPLGIDLPVGTIERFAVSEVS